MAPPIADGVSLRMLKVGVHLLLLVQVSFILMVEIKALQSSEYNGLRNANGIIKTNHIQTLDNEENASERKENPAMTYDDLTISEIRQATDNNNEVNGRDRSSEKISRFEKPEVNIGTGNTNSGGVCHMDIEYKLTKRVLGRCANLGRSARSCIAGNYLQMFHPACI